MRTIAFFLLLAFAVPVFAQDNNYAYVCNKKGYVHFFSASPLEDIEASCKEASMVLYTNDKSVGAKIPVASFVFKDKLMQEHFNENYLETDKYPISTLKMVIVENIDFTKDGVYDVTLRGTLDMHGVKHDRDIKGKLYIQGGQPVRATATFDVQLVDHKIKIPKAVIMNIAEVIKVDVDFALTKYSK